jgi:acyl-CoA synthetase (AMP-forming)/AMP-acid ligase II
MDEDGFVWFVDRVGDRYTSVGEVVYPGDIERVLMAHPAVRDAGVVGVPQEPGGEVGVAFVVVDPSADVQAEELQALCRERLSEHQVPAEVRIVDQLPRSSVGKLLRHELRTATMLTARAGFPRQ